MALTSCMLPRPSASADSDAAVRSSRYRLLTDQEQRQEAERVQRMIADLKAQQLNRSPPKRRPKSARQSRQGPLATSRAETATCQTTSVVEPSQFVAEINRAKAGIRESQERPRPTPDSGSDFFQNQVMLELQKLKKAQAMDLEAIENLRLAKEQAEHRAQQLEEKLRQSTRSFEKRGAVELVLDEDASDADADAMDDLDQGGDQAANNALDSDLDDDLMSPPGYDDVQSNDFFSSPELSPVRDPGSKWADMRPPESVSPVDFSQPKPWASYDSPEWPTRSQSPVRRRSRLESRSRQSSRRQSTNINGESTSSTPRRRSVSRSRSPSNVSKRNSVIDAGRRSTSLFLEEKQRAKEEEERLAREAAERLERARKATPPAQLLRRQEESERRKRQQIQQIDNELHAELAKEKRVKAREVPLTTYMCTDALAPSEQRELARKERMRRRSQDLLASSGLPTRMMHAAELQKALTVETSAAPVATTTPTSASAVMSVKMKKKLQEAAMEEALKRQRKPKPVPNFNRLHTRWEKALIRSKAISAPETGPGTSSKEFFQSRAAKLAELKAKKDARRQKQLAEEELERQRVKDAQARVLARARANSSVNGLVGPKPTKADTLRMQKVISTMKQTERQKQQLTVEQEMRQRRLKEATARVSQQVKHSEAKRKDEYTGTFVELNSVEAVAKQRAKESRQQFKDAIQRNKEKLLQAVAAKPSLMERFTTDVKREEHKKRALEAVVKNVFQKNFAAMKGILTEEEQELAHDIVAADEDEQEVAQPTDAKGDEDDYADDD